MLYNALILISLLFVNNLTWLSSTADVYLTGSLSVSPSYQRLGDSAAAVLILQNHTDNPLSILDVDILGETFASDYKFTAPTKIDPQSSIVIEFLIEGKKRGIQELVVYVEYNVNLVVGNSLHRIDTFIKRVEISAPLEPTWPEYLVPLILGFAISQLSTLLNDFRQRRKEQADQFTQASATTLALLQGARASIQLKEQVNYRLWDEAVVKGNLFSSLQEVEKITGKINLSNRLSELAIQLADYNDRHSKHQINSTITEKLDEELTDLIRTFENHR